MRNKLGFDLETTGTDVNKDRIVSICVVLYSPSFQKEEVFKTLVNPGIPIPLAASEIHGIYDDDVKHSPSFDEIAHKVLEMFEKSDLVFGYNSDKFDIQLLFSELDRVDKSLDLSSKTVLDAMKIYSFLFPRTLSFAYKNLTGKVLEDAHDAENDVNATCEVLQAMLGYEEFNLKTYDEIIEMSNNGKKILDFAGKFSMNDNGEEIFTFGKNANVPVKNELGYLSWMLKSDFGTDTKNWAKKLLDKYA